MTNEQKKTIDMFETLTASDMTTSLEQTKSGWTLSTGADDIKYTSTKALCEDLVVNIREMLSVMAQDAVNGDEESAEALTYFYNEFGVKIPKLSADDVKALKQFLECAEAVDVAIVALADGKYYYDDEMEQLIFSSAKELMNHIKDINRQNDALAEDGAEAFYTGGGVWISAMYIDDHIYCAIDNVDPDEGMYFYDDRNDIEGEHFGCQDWIDYKYIDDMNEEEKDTFRKLKAALDEAIF